MLKDTLQPHNNFKFEIGGKSETSSDSQASLFTEEQFLNIANFAKNYPEKAAAILQQGSSKLTGEKLIAYQIFQAVAAGSYETYLTSLTKIKEVTDPNDDIFDISFLNEDRSVAEVKVNEEITLINPSFKINSDGFSVTRSRIWKMRDILIKV